MFVLRMEHSVPSYEMWKSNGFDNDPVDRKGSGVVRHRIYRPIDDPNYVFIDLEFNTADEANAMLAKLEVMWGNVKERFGWTEQPKTRIIEVADQQDY